MTTAEKRKDTMRVVFLGTPEFACPSLQALLDRGHEVVSVVTQPDRPFGRQRKLKAPAVKVLAEKHGLEVHQPTKVRNQAFKDFLKRQNADVFVVVAYGRILTQAVLDLVPLTLNVHASLLPRWRGASPIARAIAAGDEETGVSIMRVVEALDAGDVLLTETLPIRSDDTTGSLTSRLAKLGGKALVDALDLWARGEEVWSVQDPQEVTLAPPIDPLEGKIDWRDSALNIERRCRAFDPWPGIHAFLDGERVKIFQVRPADDSDPLLGSGQRLEPGQGKAFKGRLWVGTGQGTLEIFELQVAGKRRQGAEAFLAGRRGQVPSFDVQKDEA